MKKIFTLAALIVIASMFSLSAKNIGTMDAASGKWVLEDEEEETDTTIHDPAVYLSNTLPVLYINTVAGYALEGG